VQRTRLNRIDCKPLLVFSAILIGLLASGCAASHTRVVRPSGPPLPLRVATKQELVNGFNQQAETVKSLNATVTMTLTAGSAYTGVIKQYHQIDGFILAQKPASVLVIGQAPIVGTNIFRMASDGETFRIFIPSQHKFIIGSANLQRQSAKPIENLRPQHLTNAIFWSPIPDHAPILIEEAADDSSRYYVLTVVHAARELLTPTSGAPDDWEISRRIWFDRSDLHIARVQSYESDGKLGSDVSYGGWDTFGTAKYPRQISLSRPDSDYKLQIGVKKVTLNETVPGERFVLQQPVGTELVNAAEDSRPPSDEKRPSESKPPEPRN
jgi:outer membrane lipoprotein-sorting protein